MKKITCILSACLTLTLAVSCQEDFLDKKPLDQYSGQDVWGDLALMETFVNNIYYEIPHGFDGKIAMSMTTDEAMRVADRGASNVTRSLISPADYSIFGTQPRQRKMTWEWIYKSVRACNLFLEQVAQNTYEDEALQKRLTGEVHFLRAFNYHTLVFMYGGVPLITTPYGLLDDHLAPRNTFAESIKFIAEECDRAAALLPERHQGSQKGRATKGAALALKSRVLLYAASDLYHNAAWTNGYAHPELVGYKGGDRTAHWTAAKNAAKALMDLQVYDLYKKEPAAGDDIAKNYTEVFLSKETVEDIFYRSFTQNSMESSEIYHPGLHNSSGAYHGHGSNNPTGQMADAYQMSNGEKFDWNNPMHKSSPYENREPRFYANLLFDGAKWRPRPLDVAALDPVGIIQIASRQQADGSWKGGLDTRRGPVEDWNNTGSGYYMRKFIDPTVDAQYVVQEVPWRFIRYAEVLLNYAEACNELGEDAEAQRAINLIRKRAGLPAVQTTGLALRESIRHERKIELMFEDQRFFDIRRWMIAPQVITNAQGIDIQLAYGATRPTYAPVKVQNREWKDKSYFMPIRIDEMNKNKLLIQNPLY
jgi:starch-binding outer membrane protein, SusD/RagB family